MQKDKRKKLYKKIALAVILALAAYIFLSGYIPPLIRKKAADSPTFNASISSERAAVIDDNTDALLYRLRLIESAKEEICLSTYSYYDDESGNDVACALYAAADRGVKVKILIDGFNENKILRAAAFKALAAHENAEIKIYNPVRLFTFYRSNFRMHDKYLTSDSSAYILGGRNVGDLFLGDYRTKQNIDRDVLVCREEENDGKSDSVREVKEYFSSVWRLSESKVFSSKSMKKTSTASDALRRRYTALKKSYPIISVPIDPTTETMKTRGITLIHGEVTATAKRPVLWQTLLSAVRQNVTENGAGDLLIQTPYAICDGKMYDGISALTDSGVTVRLITNSIRSGANPWGCADYLNERTAILKTGAAITEIGGSRSAHVKTMLSGENLCFIGSFNLDMRSVYLNTETVLAIDCNEMNASLREQAAAQTESGKTTRRTAGGEYVFSYGENYVFKDAPLLKRATYAALRVVLPLFRHLL
ncbi:MAG: phospholipase D-like domain-containing protein [Candidatus Borkfalkiaceae bacterium]|nr:phospholipase D-like domain-containing protein [Clostridia bacterium]MDY6223043.1 phospholipase D-like domain-containing protein [Christensenellaceae bacterium]